MGDITKNFSAVELAGHGEVWAEIPQEHKNNLIHVAKEILQPARDLLNETIFISSGYRSRRHNDAVGGAKSSQHILGNAVDIYVPSKTGLELFEFFLGHYYNKLGGIGLYANQNLKGKFIHIDIRPKVDERAITSWYCNGAGQYLAVNSLMRSIAKKYKVALLG